MKKNNFLAALALLMTVAAATSCSKDTCLTPAPEQPDNQQRVTVSINAPTTRVGFTDEATAGVKLTWSTGDKLGVYDKSNYNFIGTLDLDPSSAGKTTGSFTVNGFTFDPSTAYDVVYPYIANAPIYYDWVNAKNDLLFGENTQAGGALTHLASICSMLGTNSGTNINLKHEYSLLTIKMTKPREAETDELPTQIILIVTIHDYYNYTDTYTLTLSNWTDWNTYDAYLSIMPSSKTRDLSFQVITNKGNLFTYNKTGVKKEYETGMRYTANLGGLLALTLPIVNMGDYKILVAKTNVTDAMGDQTKTWAEALNRPDADNSQFVNGSSASDAAMGSEAGNTGCAATIEGSTGWRLPTKDELEAMRSERKSLEISWDFMPFVEDTYWSSLEFEASTAYVVNFNSDSSFSTNKSNSSSNYVRCVRTVAP